MKFDTSNANEMNVDLLPELPVEIFDGYESCILNVSLKKFHQMIDNPISRPLISLKPMNFIFLVLRRRRNGFKG